MENRTIGRLDELLLVLEQDPGSTKSGDLLNEVVAFGEIAGQKQDWNDLLRTASTLTRLEAQVKDESHRPALSYRAPSAGLPFGLGADRTHGNCQATVGRMRSPCCVASAPMPLKC
jgi:hypothetical protein